MTTRQTRQHTKNRQVVLLASFLHRCCYKISKREGVFFRFSLVINIAETKAKGGNHDDIHTDVTAPTPGGSTAKPPSEKGVYQPASSKSSTVR